MGSLSSLRSHSGNSRPSFQGHAGKRHRTFAGSEQVETSTYRDWRIRVIQKEQGITIKRKFFTVRLEGPCAPFHHSIERMPTLNRALIAARDYIDRWHENEGARWQEQRDKRERDRQFMKTVSQHRSLLDE